MCIMAFHLSFSWKVGSVLSWMCYEQLTMANIEQPIWWWSIHCNLRVRCLRYIERSACKICAWLYYLAWYIQIKLFNPVVIFIGWKYHFSYWSQILYEICKFWPLTVSHLTVNHLILVIRWSLFKKEPLGLLVLPIDGKPVDSVFSHKVLGLTLQADLRWNAHVDSIVPKAAKRLYILRILRCSNVSTTDLVTVYVTLIRPRPEYGCIVWHFSLPLCLSNRLESIQKRALRIIRPHYSYASALETLNLPSLFLRRESLCSKSFFPKSLVLPIHVSYLCSLPGAVMQMTLLLLCATLLILNSRQWVLSVSNVVLSHLCFLTKK